MKKPVIITNILFQQVNLCVKNTIITLNCFGFISYNFQIMANVWNIELTNERTTQSYFQNSLAQTKIVLYYRK